MYFILLQISLVWLQIKWRYFATSESCFCSELISCRLQIIMEFPNECSVLMLYKMNYFWNMLLALSVYLYFLTFVLVLSRWACKNIGFGYFNNNVLCPLIICFVATCYYLWKSVTDGYSWRRSVWILCVITDTLTDAFSCTSLELIGFSSNAINYCWKPLFVWNSGLKFRHIFF